VTGVADFSGVTATLQDYFDGLYECDTSRFSRVFHPEAHYYCATDGELLHLDMAQCFAIIEKRPSPKSQGHVRNDRILSIEFAGPVTAFAIAECSIPGKAFIDFLTLVHLDGRWQIVCKAFHYVTMK
jgi:Putative lumazine-binding